MSPTMGGTSRLKTFKYSYDFAVDGGAISAIVLRSKDGNIPKGSVIEGGWLDVLTLLTGASATGALSVEGANDLVSATVVTGAPYSTTGRKALVPVFTAATSIQTTAERAPTFTIALGSGVTAGKFDLYLQFV